MKSFINFIREQGIVGLAVGFILGGSVRAVVSALIEDIVNPILGIILGSTLSLEKASLAVGPIKIMWGHFLSVLIDFLVIAAVVYFIFKGLKLDKIDREKSKK